MKDLVSSVDADERCNGKQERQDRHEIEYEFVDKKERYVCHYHVLENTYYCFIEGEINDEADEHQDAPDLCLHPDYLGSSLFCFIYFIRILDTEFPVKERDAVLTAIL